MRRVSGRSLWIIFSLAVVVMLLIAVAVDRTTAKYASSEYWVSHTQQVITRMIDLRADLLSAEAARLVYVVSGDQTELPTYEQSIREIPEDMDTLRTLTTDNGIQQQRLRQLRPLIEQRIGLLQESVDLRMKSVTDAAQQQKLTESGADLARQIRSLLDAAEADEQALLKRRESFSADNYAWARGVLMLAFFAVMFILLATFAKLLGELRNREQAEEAVRRLSGRLLRVQDEERRRIARELHDSLGQLLVSLKMNLDQLLSARSHGVVARDPELLDASLELVQQSINETRTLSYLLHPPLLDEFGFASAAKWYIEGFSARSKIAVKIDIDPHFGRMADDIELSFFRVLQESLTNIHRHSGSNLAEVRVRKSPKDVTLTVIDHGKGMSAEMLEKFDKTRASVGVGLAGMRERMHQLGGTMKISSGLNGTIIEVVIPLATGALTPTKEPSRNQARTGGSTTEAPVASPPGSEPLSRGAAH
jgi:signal transduction histidine kinase